MKKRWYALPHFWGLIAAFSVLIPGLLYLLISYNRITWLLLERNIKESERHFHTVTLSLGRYVETYFDVYVNTPEILGLLKKAKYGFTVEKDIARVELFRKLFPLYKRMQNHGLIQLHFHTPDSRSFLRFNEPYRFGDTLTDVRPAVVKVNQILKSVSGFESGKSMSGYRYIYPILDNGDHLGSVEFGISFEEIRKNIAQGYEKTELLLLINKSNYLKLFKEIKRLYTTSPISPNWMLEDLDRELYSETKSLSKSSMEILMKIKSKPVFLEKIESGKRGAVQVEYNNREYGVVNLPVYDLSGNLTASVLYFGESSELTLVKKVYLFKALGILIFSILMGLLIFFNRTRRKKIKDLEMFNLKLLETVFAGIYCLDKKGNLIFINEKALEIIGYNRIELANKNVHDLVHKGETSPDECPIKNVAKTGVPYFGEEVFANKKGDRFPVRVSAVPVSLENGDMASVVVFENITLENRRKQQYLTLLKRAEDAEKTKSNFIKMITYQINTPISAISMALDILKNYWVEEKKVVDYLKVIEKGVLDLFKVAKNIDEAEEIEHIVLRPKCFSLKSLLDELEQKYSLLCEGKGLTFLKVVDESVPEFIEADEDWFGKLLDCVLENAVKFTEEGYIKLSVKGVSKSDGVVRLYFSVEDTGVGIHREHLKNITEPYVKVDFFKDGTGVGLFIFKKILERMSGDFQIRSRKALGTFVDFYLDAPIPQEACPKEGVVEDVRLGNFGALVGTEDSVIGDLLLENIKGLGGTVVFVKTSRELVALLERETFDVVVVYGNFLAYKKVIDSVNKIADRSLVIIFWDSKELKEEYVTLLNMIEIHLVAPLDFTTIKRLIVQHLSSKNVKSSKKIIDVGPFDDLLETFGDRQTVLNILEIYLKDMPIQLQRLQNALKLSDIFELKKVLHRITGESLSAGAKDIADFSKRAMDKADSKNFEIFKNYYEALTLLFEKFKQSVELFKESPKSGHEN